MTRRRLRTPCVRREEDGEEKQLLETQSRVAATDEEMERQVRSAIRDVYEALQVAGENERAASWSEVGLISELIH